MSYYPHTAADRQKMLQAIGLDSIAALFAAVPETVRFPALDLPPGLSQMEIGREMEEVARQNAYPGQNGLISFLGAGAYQHFSPAVIDYLVSRGEFLTAYTPYQPEVSQGTLQAIFEYQTMMAALTGMEVSNASHYDGATATAEAVIMAVNVLPKRKRIVMSPAVHPQYRQVVRTYTQGMDLDIGGDADMSAELGDLAAAVDQETALLIVQSPNFFGQLEQLEGVAEAVHAAGALLCVVAEPIHMALFQPPGAYGADIVCGEGQPLGIPLSFGGPYLGYFCTRNQYARKMAGRLVGQTIDADGRRSYTLALTTREQHIVRHYTRLSRLNVGVDTTFYPLGSCTMKYNPRLNEAMAHLPGFLLAHPLQDENTIQGGLRLLYDLQHWLCELNGFTVVSLQPAAGAQGEFTGILMIRAYHLDHGDSGRDTILLPDSAHGTNPATSSMAGLRVVELPTDDRGNVDMAALKANLGPHVAAMMITIPNTLGLFEEQILEVSRLVHECGGLMYVDGANINALMGIARLADLGFDVMHYNLHKTMSTPHGGGGPGAGPVAANDKMAPFLPGPTVGISAEHSQPDKPFYTTVVPDKSIGRMKAFNGNFGILVRAFAYLRAHGAAELRAVSENAVLNANYLRVKVGEHFAIPYDRVCMHEFVAEGKLEEEGLRALDISKRLMDYGFHPPSNYFPLGAPTTSLKVHEALMIEPTETESLETLDRFAEAMAAIRAEARENAELLHGAPHTAPVSRVDEVYAARNPVWRWSELESESVYSG